MDDFNINSLFGTDNPFSSDDKHIIAKYDLTVYSDGSISCERLPSDFTDISPILPEPGKSDEPDAFDSIYDFKNCSSRVEQILLVVIHYENIVVKSDMDHDEAFNFTVREISSKLGVTYQSVADKLTRQLKKSKSEIKEIILAYIFGDNDNYKQTDLKALLLKNVGSNTRTYDTRAINRLLR